MLVMQQKAAKIPANQPWEYQNLVTDRMSSSVLQRGTIMGRSNKNDHQLIPNGLLLFRSDAQFSEAINPV